MALAIMSEVFSNNGAIQSQYTCEGKDISPPLSWTGVPESAKSLALIVDDPDAPDPKAPTMTYVHWVLYNIPVASNGLSENVSKAELPKGALQGKNDWQRVGYGGPCPPIGEHRYFFKLYALDTELSDLDEPNKAKLESAMKGHVLEEAQLVGVYEKTK